MKLLSLNVGLPRAVKWRGETVTTGIYKAPVQGAVMLRRLNLDGDRQADLSVHGGVTKAVYVYPTEHLDFWRGELPDMAFAPGTFGENFSSQGLLENAVHIGDRFRIGEAEVVVTEPRMPCYKLAVKFGRTDILRRFLQSGRSGFYLAVTREGEVQAGDTFEPMSYEAHRLSVADVVRLYAFDHDDIETLRRAVQVEALPLKWRGIFQQQLDELEQ